MKMDLFNEYEIKPNKNGQALNPTRNIVQETLYIYIYIYICIIASNDNNQCMQFVCPYCGPIDWNNKYSICLYYRKCLPQFKHPKK